MGNPSDPPVDPSHLRDKIIGLGDQSIRKSYYPQLRSQIDELQRSKKELEERSAALLNILEDLEESRRVAEDNLEKFHTMADYTSDWEYWIANDNQLVYISPSCKTITGYTKEEFYKNPGLLTDLVHPDDRSLMEKHYRAAVETSEPFDAEFRILTRDGAVRWVRHSCRAILSRDGKDLGRRVSNQDITERKLAETALQRSERQLADIINFLPDGTFAIDNHGVVIAWNRAMEELTGVRAADMLGKGSYEYSMPVYGEKRPLFIDLVLQDNEEIRSLYPSVQKTGDKFISEMFIPTLYGGKGAYVWFIASPLYDPEGRVIGAIESIRDVTQRKQAEEAIRKSSREWQTTFNAITDAVFLLDDKGRIIRHNHAFELFTGKTAEDLDGRYCFDVMHGTVSPIEGCPNVKAKQSRQRESIEMKIGNRWVIVAVDPIISENGTDYGAVHLLIDITERKVAEVALNQARRKLSLLNAITFSDIQNAIFSLAGFFEIEKKLPMDEKLRQYKEKETKIVQTITESLKFTNIYQSLGLKSPEWQNVQQSFLIGISHLDISPLSRRLDISGIVIFADPLLENVFFALAENVVQHGRTATELALHYQETPEGLVLFFEDNGMGIPAELKEKIFEREYGRRKGLGLFLTREILSITGITIKETGEPGKGARFEILVPGEGYRFTKGQQQS